MSWIIVRLSDVGEYGYGGEIFEHSEPYGAIGPFDTEDEARAYWQKMPVERYVDTNVVEMSAP